MACCFSAIIADVAHPLIICIAAVGIKADESRLATLINEMKGKNMDEVRARVGWAGAPPAVAAAW